MTIPYLHSASTRLLKQTCKDLGRHEPYNEWAVPHPLSPIGRKYRGEDWPWGSVHARSLLGRIKGAKEEDGAQWMVGYGFTNGVTPDSSIPKIRADRKLEELVLAMDGLLGSKLPWYKDASLVTKSVLINMGLDMGLQGLLSYKNTLAFIKAGQWDKAANSMKLSIWYAKNGSRAKELAKRILTQSVEPQHKTEDSM